MHITSTKINASGDDLMSFETQVFGLTYFDGIMLNMNDFKEVQILLEAFNYHATVAGIRINSSKAKMMSALISDEQRQVVVPDGGPF